MGCASHGPKYKWIAMEFYVGCVGEASRIRYKALVIVSKYLSSAISKPPKLAVTTVSIFTRTILVGGEDYSGCDRSGWQRCDWLENAMTKDGDCDDEIMAKHHPDLIMCRKQPGIAIGRLCEKCDGKCVICDSYVRPCTLVRVCDECNYGSFQGRCVICGGVGISDAYYCKECTQQEKDRDGCPKIVNLGSAKTDLFYERKKYGFKKR
ncbi:hypothetical protein L1987_60754 [Smallanthus sonchifolius]|uniref:Uncharacterized protein n=1 Tax=Smallanthus sonchifolius TaxID=185202 RepID=A0ACB9D9R1_9ASTR|nr:hypothetical protein L1987_60754 [Smallanthus sonchifolius]